MTQQASESKLLTWALTPQDGGPLLEVAPASASVFEQSARGSFALRIEKLKHAISMLFIGGSKTSPIGLAEGTPSHTQCSSDASGAKAEEGCKICKDAHFEIGSAPSGQEYL